MPMLVASVVSDPAMCLAAYVCERRIYTHTYHVPMLVTLYQIHGCVCVCVCERERGTHTRTHTHTHTHK